MSKKKRKAKNRNEHNHQHPQIDEDIKEIEDDNEIKDDADSLEEDDLDYESIDNISTIEPYTYDQKIDKCIKETVDEFKKKNPNARVFDGINTAYIPENDKQNDPDDDLENPDQQDEIEKDIKDDSTDLNKKTDNKKKSSRIKKIILAIVLIIVIFIAALAITLFAMNKLGKIHLLGENKDTQITGADGADLSDDGYTVSYNGHTYQYNEDIATLLVIGVDQEEFNEGSTYQEGGYADTLFLMVIDTENGTAKMVPISRYTMVTIDEYNKDGSYWRQNEIQVTLAYAYGDGREESCENVATAISRLMYGMPISGYVAIDMSGISVLNDAIGGVTVDVLEDLTYADSQLYEGNTITLMGDQALTYVRSRKSEGTDLVVDNNAPRMARQSQYLSAFLSQTLDLTKSDLTLPLKLYNIASDYTITDVSASETVYLLTQMARHGLDNTIVDIPATAQEGEYTEVYVDDEKLYEIILDVFYEVVE